MFLLTYFYKENTVKIPYKSLLCFHGNTINNNNIIFLYTLVFYLRQVHHGAYTTDNAIHGLLTIRFLHYLRYLHHAGTYTAYNTMLTCTTYNTILLIIAIQVYIYNIRSECL